MENFPINEVAVVIEMLVNNNARVAVKYLSDKSIIRARRKCFHGKIHRGNIEIILTIGKPNYQERDFIKKCKKAGEPFPVKKIQLKYPKR